MIEENPDTYELLRRALGYPQKKPASHWRILVLKGVKKTLVEWSKELGIPLRRIRQRLSRGWGEEDALLRKRHSKVQTVKVLARN